MNQSEITFYNGPSFFQGGDMSYYQLVWLCKLLPYSLRNTRVTLKLDVIITSITTEQSTLRHSCQNDGAKRL